jgi:hypothetical protein
LQLTVIPAQAGIQVRQTAKSNPPAASRRPGFRILLGDPWFRKPILYPTDLWARGHEEYAFSPGASTPPPGCKHHGIAKGRFCGTLNLIRVVRP